MTNRAYAKSNGVGLLCSILCFGASLAQSSLPLRLWVRFSLRTHNTYVKRVSQRSTESRGFTPGTPVSSHR